MVKEQKKGKKEEKIIKQSKSKEGVHTGGFSNHGQEYNHEFIVQASEPVVKVGNNPEEGKLLLSPNKLLTESIAKFLWSKYDRTKLSDDWDKETPQRQLRWINDAETLRQLVDEYYEE